MRITDQLGRELNFTETPKRIVSVVPSQTEYLYDLGLADRIVAQTIFCIHPSDKFKTATKVGGTKRLHIEKIRELQPDIIIANKEENEQDQIGLLANEFPVWISDIKTLQDACAMMNSLGEIFDRREQALLITDQINRNFNAIQSKGKIKKALYLIWREPWMAVGRDTFIHEMLNYAGFENAVEESNSRYPELDTEQMKQLNPEVLLLSSEPYPFGTQHVAELKAIFPQTTIMLVDGEMFSWYGSRLLKAPKYFDDLALSH